MSYLKGEKMHIFYSILLGIAGGLVGVSIFGLERLYDQSEFL